MHCFSRYLSYYAGSWQPHHLSSLRVAFLWFFSNEHVTCHIPSFLWHECFTPVVEWSEAIDAIYWWKSWQVERAVIHQSPWCGRQCYCKFLTLMWPFIFYSAFCVLGHKHFKVTFVGVNHTSNAYRHMHVMGVDYEDAQENHKFGVRPWCIHSTLSWSLLVVVIIFQIGGKIYIKIIMLLNS